MPYLSDEFADAIRILGEDLCPVLIELRNEEDSKKRLAAVQALMTNDEIIKAITAAGAIYHAFRLAMSQMEEKAAKN